MKMPVVVAQPPSKPLLVFDGDCHFCSRWIRRWRQITGDAVDFLPFQDGQIAARFPEIPPQEFEKSIQLLAPDGAVFSGAEAVFHALAQNPKRKWPLRFYEISPAFARFAEHAYEFVAAHRAGFSRLTRWLWGRHVEAPDYFLTRWVFLRALAVIYLVAFLSLGTQIIGLVGHRGILPADQFLAAAKQQCEAQGIGWERFYLLPTLCWLNPSDGFLKFQCVCGIFLAGLLLCGVAPPLCLALLWLVYLSLVTIGRDFLGFQWDNLLLETGFLAIFFAPRQWLPEFRRAAPPSKLVLWLLRLLLFKLMFSSGCVKLASGDPNWRNLTALTFHYYTQPLPTPLAWYANQLPVWFQKCSCAAMFAIELGAPWLIFFPRRLRFWGGAAIAWLQFLILLTGNYTFFNWLTLTLCLLLLDDFVLGNILPASWRIRSNAPTPQRLVKNYWPRALALLPATVFIGLSLFQIAAIRGPASRWFYPAAKVNEWLAPFRTVNPYGLFAVMTTARREIIVQGSNDGTNWLTYEFKYKPGDVHRRPPWVAPFQPRLDWQMWFAALGDWRQNPWFVAFCEQLLRGSPPVLALLKNNPFPDRPPRFIRAEFYDYRFTNFAARRATGAWWQRQFLGEYLPPMSLRP